MERIGQKSTHRKQLPKAQMLNTKNTDTIHKYLNGTNSGNARGLVNVNMLSGYNFFPGLNTNDNAFRNTFGLVNDTS